MFIEMFSEGLFPWERYDGSYLRVSVRCERPANEEMRPHVDQVGHQMALWVRSNTRKVQLYLGVWARVKRRLWRLMLRFISSFLNSSGEFRGDPRGESLGEILGEPPGEPALDLGMSLMSLVNLWSCGISSTSDSSELSVHSWLMAGRQRRGRDWSLCSPGLRLNWFKKIK